LLCAVMDCEGFFKERLKALHAEGRYASLPISSGAAAVSRAFDHRIGAEVTVWCSNDYLGMGSTRRFWRQ
jgi:5-aminolevulinate synthase